MNEQNKNTNNDLTPILYILMAAVIAYAAIFLVLAIGVILTVCLTAGAGYLGFKAALDTKLWQERRITKDRTLEAARTAELAHYQSQGNEWMEPIVGNYFDDKKRGLYQDTSPLDTVTNTVRKVRDAIR